MSRTRNQRRRDDLLFDRIVTLIVLVLLIALTVMMFRQCKDINALQEQINSTNVTVVRAESFLPDGFDPNSSEYRAALQRYDIEHGYVIPEQKETAPEAATSEAADARDIAS